MIGHSGWGRYLHFLSAWICVLTGLLYALPSLRNQHFSKNLLPAMGDLNWGRISHIVWDEMHWKRPSESEALTYNVVQRLTYLAVMAVIALVTTVIAWIGSHLFLIGAVIIGLLFFGGSTAACTGLHCGGCKG